MASEKGKNSANNQKVTENAKKNQLNQVQKSKAKKYYVNKIVNINYNSNDKTKKVKTKHSYFQTNPDKFKENPKIHQVFQGLSKAVENSNIFNLMDYFTSLNLKNYSKDEAYDKQVSLSNEFGKYFSSKASFESILAESKSSFELYIWRLFLSEKRGINVAGKEILNLPETINFVNCFFKPES